MKARLQRGETVPFGGIGLSATAVTWKNNSIPLSEQITKAELVRGNLCKSSNRENGCPRSASALTKFQTSSLFLRSWNPWPRK